MSNAFSLSSKGSGCLIFARNYLTNCVSYYGAKIIHQDSLEDCKKVLDIKRRAVFLPAPHCVNHSRLSMLFPAHHSNVSHGQHDRQDQLEHGVSISLTQARQREQRDGRDKVDLGEN